MRGNIRSNQVKESRTEKKNKIPYPDFGVATSAKEAVELSSKLNFPILVRPSYVLGGQGMKIVINKEELEEHVVVLLSKIPNNKNMSFQFYTDLVIID